MVNKTLLPPPQDPGKTPNPLQNQHFQTWHGFRSLLWRTAGLGEPGGSHGIRRRAWEGFFADRQRGELPMENALLIGLSRQMVLERQGDVVANNVANANTNGFKADQSLFQEYLKTGAHEDNFVGKDRSVSYVLDAGTYRDFSQGALQSTNNPLDVAIDSGGFLAVQTAG